MASEQTSEIKDAEPMRITEVIKNLITSETTSYSPTIGKLAESLAKAQGEMSGAKKGANNPFFSSRYADLASVIGAIREPLASNGLAHVQIPGSDVHGLYVETTLMHSSGEWIRGKLYMRIPDRWDKEAKQWVSGDTPQGRGSAISYARRYAIQAMVGLEAEDDDGNRATHHRSNPDDSAITEREYHREQQSRANAAKPTMKAEDLPTLEEPAIKDWRDTVCHAGKKGGSVKGKRLGDLSDTSLHDLWEIYKTKEVRTVEDCKLKASLFLWSAGKAKETAGSVTPFLDQLEAKIKMNKIDPEIITAVAHSLGSTAKIIFDIKEDEAQNLLANWDDTLTAVESELKGDK